jgi:hypothetical protein
MLCLTWLLLARYFLTILLGSPNTQRNRWPEHPETDTNPDLQGSWWGLKVNDDDVIHLTVTTEEAEYPETDMGLDFTGADGADSVPITHVINETLFMVDSSGNGSGG